MLDFFDSVNGIISVSILNVILMKDRARNEVIRMGITINEVAKAAGVAPSTVSRVISDSPLISERTKRKVKRIMEELGYHPNINARNLANKSSQTLGIVMPSSASKAFQNPFFPEVIRGISSTAHIKDYSLLISTGETEDQILEAVEKMVMGKRVDGIILLYSRENDPIIQYLLNQEFPFVLVGKPYQNVERITYINNDNYGAAREVTNMFIRKGHTKIAFVGGSRNFLVTQDRLNGYCDAMKLADLPLCNEYIFHDDFLFESGKVSIDHLLSLKNPPTAIVAADDIIALGILSSLAEQGIQVPEQISIISFNNLVLTKLATPSLSSVDVNIFQLGNEATKLVIEKIQSNDSLSKSVVVPYRIIERQSSMS